MASEQAITNEGIAKAVAEALGWQYRLWLQWQKGHEAWQDPR